MQEAILAYNLKVKHYNKKQEQDWPTLNVFILCEHAPVYTLGKSGKMENLMLNGAELAERGIAFHHINRGGDITYHGPGQITGYPVLDLECFKPSAAWYIEQMENMIIYTLDKYGLKGNRIDGLTGVWLNAQSENPEKVCAIGVKMSRYVSIHGFALNVATDLDYFKHIIPCGIDDKGVTSMSKSLCKPVAWEDVAETLLEEFPRHFHDSALQDISLDELHSALKKVPPV